ncbi:MAG: YlbF family regulator [Clostridia bacterium]|nr:YlbF family regulator [Clostridia bacterium]
MTEVLQVVEKTRELGEAIVASGEYREMQIAEAEAKSDPAAVQLENSIRELVSMLQKETDETERLELSRQLEALKQSLAALPVINRRDRAREGFSRLMEQVNNVLQFTITGEISALSSCSGNCGSCHGCS